MTENNKYYTPSIEEFIPGFKCETCYCLFTTGDNPDEWVEIEFTKELLDKYMSAIKYDAYKTEFRAIK